MKIFKIRQDCNRYRRIRELDLHSDVLARASTGTPQSDVWIPPPVYLDNPKRKTGDFLNAADSYLVASQKATDALRSLFDLAGELLPLPFGDDLYWILNVCEVVDCLDQQKTEWAGSGQFKMMFERIVFIPERLSSSPIFKIPDRTSVDIFVSEGLMKPDQEFREIVKWEGLKGLTFEEVWASDAGRGADEVRWRIQEAKNMATEEEFLNLVWEDINGAMKEHWIDNVIHHAKQHPDAPFADIGPVVERLLALGASRRDLCLLVRFAAYEEAFTLLYQLTDPGVEEDSIDSLHENLLAADPSGLEGRPGSAPEIQKPIEGDVWCKPSVRARDRNGTPSNQQLEASPEISSRGLSAVAAETDRCGSPGGQTPMDRDWCGIYRAASAW